MTTDTLAWCGSNPTNRFPIHVRIDGNTHVLDVETARVIARDLRQAIRDVEEWHAREETRRVDGEQVRAALRALLVRLDLNDGERGLRGAMWDAIRALSPRIAGIAERDLKEAAYACGEPCEEDDDT